MTKYIAIFIINLCYCVILLYTDSSEIHHINELTNDQIITHYNGNITTDTDSYANMPKHDTFRTVGYPYVLRFFMLSQNFILWMLVFNCLLATWLFYVVFQLIGKAAWVLAVLGAFTAYVPLLLADLLFAALFVTSIWQIKKRLWLHFLLLGLASLVRPSLAWFFLIEPFVLYFNGYRGRILYYSAIIAFAVTSFNPIRNTINTGQWTHSTVLQYNMQSERYFGGRESVPQYFVKSLKDNYLSDHYKYIGNLFNKFKIENSGREASRLLYHLNFLCYIINVMIWYRFGVRVLQRKVNFGYILILGYFIAPTLFSTAGARFRLPIEWILLI